MFDDKAMLGEPGVEERSFAGPNFMAEARTEEAIAEHQTRVGCEHQIGQPWLRRHELDAYAEFDQRVM